MHDNKLRLSPDVIEKAEQIATAWGLKNSRAAIEAVFRKYADDYLYGRQSIFSTAASISNTMLDIPEMIRATVPEGTAITTTLNDASCQAASELDSLLGI
jgi:hypothetical protein